MSVENKPNYTPENDSSPPYSDGDLNVSGWYLDHRESRVHFEHGRISKSDGPAVIYKNKSEVWYKDGLLHRDNDEPSVTMLDNHGRIEKQYYHVEGKLHRSTDKPAASIYEYEEKTDNLVSKSLTYYQNGQISRSSAPALEIYGKKDAPIYVEYIDAAFGGFHRASGPAIECKSKKYEAWYFCNVMHCENGGPALKQKGVDFYFLNGKEVSKKEAVTLFSSGTSMLPHILKNFRMESSQKTGIPIPTESDFNSEAERKDKAKDFVSAWKSKNKKY